MLFKMLPLMCGLMLLTSCTDPFTYDTRLKPGPAVLTALPVDPVNIRYMQGYGNLDFGGGNAIFHSGIDMGVTGASAPFYSCADGIVTGLDLNTGQGRPGTNYRITIQVTASTAIAYHFELDGSASEQERKDNIFVKAGDYVKAGQKIANLISIGTGAHVDFGTSYYGKRDTKCTLLFFNADKAQEMENMYATCADKRPPSRGTICE